MTDGKVITNVIDGLAVISSIIESANNEVIYISPPSLLIFSSHFGLVERAKQFIQKGGRVRGIIDFSYQYIEEIRELLDIGEDVRYIPQYQGIFLLVRDRKESISSMSVDATSLSIDTPIVALWNEDLIYAEYLGSTFEMAWEQAIPAAERIEELLREGPPNL
jgi:hypothetical protein